MEAEWLASNDLLGMLEYVCDRASDRKLRLFALACCRSVSAQLRCRQHEKALENLEAMIVPSTK
jgi:hypothetical protein